MEIQVIGNCELYLADAREVLPLISGIDAVVTDPPYGVQLGNVRNGQAREKKQKSYCGFEDTPKYIQDVIVPIIQSCIERYGRVVATTGNRNMWAYPPADDFGVWYNPAGTGRGKWGYNLVVTPILYYGKDPRAGVGSTPSSCWGKSDSVVDIKRIHPCPKPLLFTKWLVDKASLDGETILDPFMGSGTTGVAAVKLGRKFVGIELEPSYFELACERIRKAYAEPDFFIDNAGRKQERML